MHEAEARVYDVERLRLEGPLQGEIGDLEPAVGGHVSAASSVTSEREVVRYPQPHAGQSDQARGQRKNGLPAPQGGVGDVYPEHGAGRKFFRHFDCPVRQEKCELIAPRARERAEEVTGAAV
jgi:hypothetical protein